MFGFGSTPGCRCANPGRREFSDGEVPAETLVWTAGTAPNPLLKSLPLRVTNVAQWRWTSPGRVPGFPNVWALGDCAAVNDAETGKPCPPTAQFAIREAEVLPRIFISRIARTAA